MTVGAQVMDFNPTPWSLDDKGEQRFKKILRYCLILAVILSIMMVLFPVTEKERPEPEKIPPAIAKLIIERQKPPPPPKPIEKLKPKPTKVNKPKPKPRPKPSKPVAKPDARARAEQAFASIRDELPAIDDDPIMAKLQIDRPLSTAGRKSNSPKRELVIDEAAPARTTAGINPQFKRGAGQVKLKKRSTTKLAKAGPAGRSVSPGGKGGHHGGSKPQRSRADVLLYLEKRQAQVDRLYRRALRANPGLVGQVVVSFTILPNGHVSNCKIVSSELNGPALERKIVLLFKRFNFGPLKVDAASFNYPIDFTPNAS